MKFTIASLMAVAVAASPFKPKKTRRNAKAKYVSGLLEKAKPIRKLDEDFPVDISQHFVKFEKCQFVRSYDDELADDEEAKSVLGTTRFAIFRLCPSDCTQCDYNYGEYMINLENYLEEAVKYFQEWQENMCGECEENCGNNNNRKLTDFEQKMTGRYLQDVDCNQCVDDCEKIENMEDNGFVDATEFLDCIEIYDNGQDDDNAIAYFAGAVCSQGGDKIKVGVFSDENCQTYEPDLNVEDYLEVDEDNGQQMQLSHALLKMTYQDTCISCTEVDWDNQNNDDDDNNDEEDEDNVLDFCEDLYNMAGKCEFSHGFDNGYYGVYGYEVQMAQEDLVCQYIQSLKSGTYDEEGEINVSGASYSVGGGSSTTGGQKFALTFFILGTVGLAVYAAMLHSKLTKGAVAVDAGSGALA